MGCTNSKNVSNIVETQKQTSSVPTDKQLRTTAWEISKTIASLSGHDKVIECRSRWHLWTNSSTTFIRFCRLNGILVVLGILLDHATRPNTTLQVRINLVDTMALLVQNTVDPWIKELEQYFANFARNPRALDRWKQLLEMYSKYDTPVRLRRAIIRVFLFLTKTETKSVMPYDIMFLTECQFWRHAEEVLARRLDDESLQISTLYVIRDLIFWAPRISQVLVHGEICNKTLHGIIRLCGGPSTSSRLAPTVVALHLLFDIIVRVDLQTVQELARSSDGGNSIVYILAKHLEHHIKKFPLCPGRVQAVAAIVAIVRELMQDSSLHELIISSGIVRLLLIIATSNLNETDCLAACKAAQRCGIELRVQYAQLRKITRTIHNESHSSLRAFPTISLTDYGTQDNLMASLEQAVYASTDAKSPKSLADVKISSDSLTQQKFNENTTKTNSKTLRSENTSHGMTDSQRNRSGDDSLCSKLPSAAIGMIATNEGLSAGINSDILLYDPTMNGDEIFDPSFDTVPRTEDILAVSQRVDRLKYIASIVRKRVLAEAVYSLYTFMKLKNVAYRILLLLSKPRSEVPSGTWSEPLLWTVQMTTRQASAAAMLVKVIFNKNRTPKPAGVHKLIALGINIDKRICAVAVNPFRLAALARPSVLETIWLLSSCRLCAAYPNLLANQTSRQLQTQHDPSESLATKQSMNSSPQGILHAFSAYRLAILGYFGGDVHNKATEYINHAKSELDPDADIRTRYALKDLSEDTRGACMLPRFSGDAQENIDTDNLNISHESDVNDIATIRDADQYERLIFCGVLADALADVPCTLSPDDAATVSIKPIQSSESIAFHMISDSQLRKTCLRELGRQAILLAQWQANVLHFVPVDGEQLKSSNILQQLREDPKIVRNMRYKISTSHNSSSVSPLAAQFFRTIGRSWATHDLHLIHRLLLSEEPQVVLFGLICARDALCIMPKPWRMEQYQLPLSDSTTSCRPPVPPHTGTPPSIRTKEKRQETAKPSILLPTDSHCANASRLRTPSPNKRTPHKTPSSAGSRTRRALQSPIMAAVANLSSSDAIFGRLTSRKESVEENKSPIESTHSLGTEVESEPMYDYNVFYAPAPWYWKGSRNESNTITKILPPNSVSTHGRDRSHSVINANNAAITSDTHIASIEESFQIYEEHVRELRQNFVEIGGRHTLLALARRIRQERPHLTRVEGGLDLSDSSNMYTSIDSLAEDADGLWRLIHEIVNYVLADTARYVKPSSTMSSDQSYTAASATDNDTSTVNVMHNILQQTKTMPAKSNTTPESKDEHLSNGPISSGAPNNPIAVANRLKVAASGANVGQYEKHEINTNQKLFHRADRSNINVVTSTPLSPSVKAILANSTNGSGKFFTSSQDELTRTEG